MTSRARPPGRSAAASWSEHAAGVGDVVDGENANGRIVDRLGRPWAGQGGIGDMEREAGIARVAGAGGVNQTRAGIDGRDDAGTGGDEMGEHDTLATAKIEHFFARFDGEQAERGGQDDILVIIRALFADELVVPGCHGIPAAVARRLPVRTGWPRPVGLAGLAGVGAAVHSTTLRLLQPMPSMPISMTSPGSSQRGGFMPMATPAGVPVAMISPGSRVMNRLA